MISVAVSRRWSPYLVNSSLYTKSYVIAAISFGFIPSSLNFLGSTGALKTILNDFPRLLHTSEGRRACSILILNHSFLRKRAVL